MVLYYFYILINFLKLYQNLFTQPNHKKTYGVRHSVRAGSNPRRRPRPPPLMLTLYYLGEKLIGSVSGRQAAEKLSEGVKINRRRHNYPGRPQVGKKFAKKNFTVSITVAQCRKYPIPYLYTLSQTISYLYTLN